MRASIVWLCAFGCASPTTGPGSEPDPKGWNITVDMSRLDRFVTAPSWRVGGVATATEGLAGVDVNGSAAAVATDGAFSTDVSITAGLVPVPVLARDLVGHERKGDRTLIATAFLPEGALAPQSAALVVSNTTLSAMSAGLTSQTGNVDVAGEIMSKDTLSQDDRCVTWPTGARQGTVQVSLAQDQSGLVLRIVIPNLDVYFAGECQGLLSTIPLAGEMHATIVVQTRLTALPPADGGCLSAFAHTTPTVSVQNWYFDVWGTAGPLQDWIVSMFRDQKSAEARAQLATEVGTRADQLLAEKLASISVFERTSELTLLDRPIAMQLCLTALDAIGGRLVARVGAATTGAGTREAPGAPQIDGALPAVAPNELVLDANLVAQLLFSAWRDGGFARTAPDVDVGVLQVLMPGLYERHPDATSAQVAIDGELPPLVRATPSGPGDLRVELGDLMVTVSVEGERILTFGVNLELELALEPTMGGLAPKVLDSRATVALLDELLDGADAALEQAVQVQIGGSAAQLIGNGTVLALPDLPGLGAPSDVTADAGGRYVRVKLSP